MKSQGLVSILRGGREAAPGGGTLLTWSHTASGVLSVVTTDSFGGVQFDACLPPLNIGRKRAGPMSDLFTVYLWCSDRA